MGKLSTEVRSGIIVVMSAGDVSGLGVDFAV